MAEKQFSRTMLIGVAGASGSGKSFFSNLLKSQLKNYHTIILSQDDYYKDRSHIPVPQRSLMNYDHPDAIDFDLLVEQLAALKNGHAIEHPLYDFRVHNRKKETKTSGPADIVIMDGILIYVPEECRALFDIKVFVDTPPDICLVRRLRRDVEERGRTMESVLQQYMDTVRPMFERFVAPTAHFTDFVVAGIGDMMQDVNRVQKTIRSG